MGKLKWYLCQILPLSYRSKYHTDDGKKHFCVWNMWMGRCFDVEDYIVCE